MTEEIWSKIKRVASSIFKEEVKTPLKFYFRVAALAPTALAAILLASGSDNFKFRALLVTLGFFSLISLVVAVFAWNRPKNLVFGESGHRAELKLEYGTSQHVLTRREAVSLGGVPAPKQLKRGLENS